MAEKVLNKYIAKIKDSRKDGQKSWWASSYDQEKLLSALLSFDKKNIKKIVSDDYWVNYPSWSSSTVKKYGPAIENTVRGIYKSYPKLFDFISIHGNGLWQMFILDNASGSSKIKLSKKYLNARDKRVVLRAVKLVNSRQAKRFVTHSNYGIRTAAIKKVGIENCYKDIISNDSFKKTATWLRREALRHADLSDFNYKEELMNSLLDIGEANSSGSWEPYSSILVAEDILLKMKKEELLYYMDYISNSQRLSETVRRRIGSEWG
tara:strand:+ start:7969 stop:8760 length:792 start_codon:yes stop_codon:yes gene_type:complete